MFLQDFGSLFKSQITSQSNLHIVTLIVVDMTENSLKISRYVIDAYAMPFRCRQFVASILFNPADCNLSS